MESEAIQQVPQMQATVDQMQAAAAEVKAEADMVSKIIKNGKGQKAKSIVLCLALGSYDLIPFFLVLLNFIHIK